MDVTKENTDEDASKNDESEEKASIEDDSYYDFMAFLNLLRSPAAKPIVNYTKSFLHKFHMQREYWDSDEQVKLINDFKIFIYDKFTTINIFAQLNKPELRNAKEGMEKLLMGKLYCKCFSPCIKEYNPDIENGHSSDILQDAKLTSKIEEFSFLSPEHFEILPSLINPRLDRFVSLSAKELSNINKYKSPRDKMVCVLNCCKVLFGFLKQNNPVYGGADYFLPLLIFTVLRANVKNLVSNVNYIERFRFPDFLEGESAYYLSTLQGAVNFILDMDRDSLNIYEGESLFREKYDRNAARLEKLRETSQDVVDLNTDPSKSIHHYTNFHSPSPSDYILKPLDDAASSVVTKFNKLFSSTTNSIIGTDTSENDFQEIDEQKAAKIGQEMEEKDRKNTLETLKLMFPDLEEDLIDDVCVATKYRVGVCVDALLEIS